MKKEYVMYKFTGKIEARTKDGDFEVLQSVDGEGLRVASLAKIKKWIDLLKSK